MNESGHFIAITFTLIASVAYSQIASPAATPAAKTNPFLERKSGSSKPGLRVVEHPRHSSQGDEENLYVPLEQLGQPVGRSYTVKSVHPWKWNGERNAVASGFLKIDADGEYSFTSTSFYDRNMLMVDGKIVCKFRDGEETVATILLKRGLVPIVSVGYVGGRGTTEGIKLKWKPPGQIELREIPSKVLSH